MRQIYFSTQNFSLLYINLIISLIPSHFGIIVSNNSEKDLLPLLKDKNLGIIFGTKRDEECEKIRFRYSQQKEFIYHLGIDEFQELLNSII